LNIGYSLYLTIHNHVITELRISKRTSNENHKKVEVFLHKYIQCPERALYPIIFIFYTSKAFSLTVYSQ